MAQVAAAAKEGSVKRRAAVADDDDDSRSLIVRALQRDGYEVIEARDGNELLRNCEQLLRLNEPLHAVISDIYMPECDGINATRALLTRFPLVPIILLTGFRDAATWRAAHESGACVVLSKPIAVRDIMVALGQALAKKTRVRFYDL